MNANEILSFSFSIENLLNNPYAIAIVYFVGLHFIGRRVAAYIAQKKQKHNKRYYPNVYPDWKNGLVGTDRVEAIVIGILYPISIVFILLGRLMSFFGRYFLNLLPNEKD